jgi:hypothetical protein
MAAALLFFSCAAGAQDDSAADGAAPAESGGDGASLPSLSSELDFNTGLPVTVSRGSEYRSPDLPEAFQGQTPPTGAGATFDTDFSRGAVSYADILSGGPGKDGIPAIDEPQFVSAEQADSWLAPQEPVLVTGLQGEGVFRESDAANSSGGADPGAEGRVRIYPLQILMWHEIVNDTVGGVPVAVTYCPLCDTGIVFLRRFDGKTLDFGTTGRLRYSNLIMYDRQTETWWQQASGRAIAGRYAGAQLRILPVLKLSWREARSRYPEARVLSRETGYSRPYGRNPYAGYDTAERPFLYRGPAVNGEREAMERVYAVQLGGSWEAFPYGELRSERVVQTELEGQPLVVFWQPGQASALDERDLDKGRAVGSANGFVPKVGGRLLDFYHSDGEIRDRQTGSRWDASGTAVAGELAGKRLEPVPGTGHFWFSWYAFMEGAKPGEQP